MSGLELAERIRALALSLPEAYEDEPWGHPVFKVGANRMFAGMSVDGDVVHLTVKLTPEEREIAQLLPYVRRASYVGRYGWVTAEVSDDETARGGPRVAARELLAAPRRPSCGASSRSTRRRRRIPA